MDEEIKVNSVEEAEETKGNVKISVDVVSTIAGMAAMESTGVYDMAGSFAGGIAERFGAKKNPNKGVKVEISDNVVTVDLYIIVKYGIKIPELAWEMQEKVKNNIESMTGMSVNKVNIHIEGVNFSDEKNSDAAPEPIDGNDDNSTETTAEKGE